MSLFFDSLLPASFKGVPFFFISDSREDGRRIVIHEYVNKNDEPEDLGRNLPQHNISGVIKGANYFQDKINFENALNSEGDGILVHPYLGNIPCVCLSFGIDESLSSLGIATYSLQFKVVNKNIYPAPTSDVRTIIANLYRQIYKQLGEILENYYKITNILNVNLIGDKLNDLANILRNSVKTLGGTFDTAAEANSTIKNFINNSYKVAASNIKIGGAIADVIGSVDNISTDGELRFNIANNLFGFGFNDIFLDLKTQRLEERNTNFKLINGAINALFLTNKIDAAKLITYNNSDAIEEKENSINESYFELINNDNVFLPDAILTLLRKLRVNAKTFFNAERTQVSKVITITINPQPLANLVYDYYGSLDNFETIRELNNIYNTGRVAGEIKILEAE
jgi:prophage DNA circulation protein